jgi:hypothetical protein
MQGLWYGDKRDRVKWGALVHLSNTKGIRCIVQVAYFRHGTDLKLQTEEGEVELPVQVWNHFSNLRHIERLGEATGLKIIVLDQLFDPGNRFDYISMICLHLEEINKEINSRKIIFLDPDTGIEPEKSSGYEHVTRKDIEKIWKALSESDLLVIYQHADRTKKWMHDRRKRMSLACGGVDVEIISGEDIASDVAMLWCCKVPTAKPDPNRDLADLKSTKTSKKQKTPRPCAHQCGQMTKGGYFFPGHDSKMKSLFREIASDPTRKPAGPLGKMYDIWVAGESRRLIDIAKEVLGE